MADLENIQVVKSWKAARKAAFSVLLNCGANRSVAEEVADEACAHAFEKGLLGEVRIVRKIAKRKWCDRIRRQYVENRYVKSISRSSQVVDPESNLKDNKVALKGVIKSLESDRDVELVLCCMRGNTTPTNVASGFGMSESNARRRFLIGMSKIRTHLNSNGSVEINEQKQLKKEKPLNRILQQFGSATLQAAIVQNQRPELMESFRRSAWHDPVSAAVLEMLLTFTPTSGSTAVGRQQITIGVLSLITTYGENEVYRAFDNLKHFLGVAATTT